jgi:ABC-type Mn2+/Zn2+ transport system permease subunit
VLLLFGQRVSRSPAEWGVGALFAMASAATILFVALNPTGDLEMTNLLRGELLSLGDADLIVLAVATAIALLLFLAFRREILLASFDAEFARSIGREPGRADALLFGLLGVAIALGVMDAGPLVVFGFLVLPALAALRIAPGIGFALIASAVIGVLSSVFGFVIAYRADLPTGPTSVALAAACWLAAAGVARLRRQRRAAAAVLLALPLGLGCAHEGAPGPLPRGTLPDLAGRGPVVSARFRNETGATLRIPSGNPLAEVKRAVGAEDDPAWGVADALQQQAVFELSRRGVAVHGFEADRALLPEVPVDARTAAEGARGAGVEAPVLFGVLRRFTVSGGLLLARLDLALVDPGSGEILWSGSARRPVAVKSALTAQEILIDAGPKLFAEAFGSD